MIIPYTYCYFLNRYAYSQRILNGELVYLAVSYKPIVLPVAITCEGDVGGDADSSGARKPVSSETLASEGAGACCARHASVKAWKSKRYA